MKAKYRKGTRYFYLVTFSYSPLPMNPGCAKISTVSGTFVLKYSLKASDMMEEVMFAAKEASNLPQETAIFPSLYHVEEQYETK